MTQPREAFQNDGAHADPLTRALLPVVLHKLANTTQLVTGLHALLGLDGGEELFAARSADLLDASRAIEGLGWVMAVLGSASGADLLMERREPGGLSILVPLVADAARRAGRPIAAPPGEPPRIAPSALDGWQLPWAVGSVLWAASCDSGGDRPVPWTLERTAASGEPLVWRLAVPSGEHVRRCAATVLPALPGAAVGEGARWSLALPEEWFLAAPRVPAQGA